MPRGESSEFAVSERASSSNSNALGESVYAIYPQLRLDALICVRPAASGELLPAASPQQQGTAEERRLRREQLEAQCGLFERLAVQAQEREADTARVIRLLQETDRLNAQAQEQLRRRRAPPAAAATSSKPWAGGLFR